jgi:ubiquinone biosynthesis protein
MNSYLKIYKLARALVPLLVVSEDAPPEKIIHDSQRLRLLLQQMGPTYIKFGQILSARYDLLPTVSCQELEKLLDSGAALEFSTIKKIVQKELGEKADVLLKTMEKTPLSVASIGQVHVAKVKGTKVAVKVQKPNIQKLIERDMNSIVTLVRLISRFPRLRNLGLVDVVEDFRLTTLRELDYNVEALNTQKFAEIFVGNKHVKIPEVFLEFSSSRILVTEFITGISVREAIATFTTQAADKFTLRGHTFDAPKFVRMMTKILHLQVFEQGLMHGDPHASNIIIIDQDTIAYIDMGIILKVNPIQREVLQRIFLDLASDNRQGLVSALMELDQKRGVASEEELLDKFAPYFNKFQSAYATEYSPVKFLLDIIYQAARLDLQLPLFFATLGRLFSYYESMLQKIDPKTSFLDLFLPVHKQYKFTEVVEKMNPLNNQEELGKLLEEGADTYKLLRSLPKEMVESLHEFHVNGIKFSNMQTSSTSKVNHEHTHVVLFLLNLISTSTLLFVALQYPDTAIRGIHLSLLMLINWIIITLASIFYLLQDNHE